MVIFFWISVVLFSTMIVVTIYQQINKKSPQANELSNTNVLTLTDESFQEIIKEGVSLVDFWAPWCGPCKAQNPIIDQIANEIGDRAKICKLNVDDHKKAAVQMKIKNIPNIIIFKDGEPVKQLIGRKSKRLIVGALDSVLVV